ncbi:hypothetical protein KSX_93720 [Ktedonospora formicarum]|uniref:Uncharacterized protein n=1 Tax=Ktedonospora formicarum TaxID=2778364 RepID=A0A8J3I7Z9_9CHLR|nr:hypothetical protein KSX_93720 [Ktedonospora formicarum]
MLERAQDGELCMKGCGGINDLVSAHTLQVDGFNGDHQALVFALASLVDGGIATFTDLLKETIFLVQE